jgi:N-acetyl-anhydromuramyl-L-alanine amidase AmpD
MIAPDRISTSPHSNPFPPSGQGVVIHATRSGKSMNPTELEGTLNWFKNPVAQVSSHWVIGRNGEKVRVIADDRQAWHAGIHNATHWGIEVVQGVESDGFTEPQLMALVEVCKGYGVPVAHDMNGFVGHQETPQGRAVGKSDPGRLFPWEWFIEQIQEVPVDKDAQIKALAAALFILTLGNPITDLGPEDQSALWSLVEGLPR